MSNELSYEGAYQAEMVPEAVVEIPPEPPKPRYPEVMTEIAKIQNKKKGWLQFIATLALSMGLFFLVEYAQAQKNGTTTSTADVFHSVYFIIPILLFHELGHFIAMKVFGYKNVQMFFIPFFGAAVSGQRYGLAAWKKVVVSLMGPVPGIFLGCALAIPALVYNNKTLLEGAMLMVIINSFNLIPILPLDGGRVMQTLLFCRHPILDVGFRSVAALLLIAFGASFGGYATIGVSVGMLMALPVIWRTGKLAAAMRDGGATTEDSADSTLDQPLLVSIIDLLKQDKFFAKIKNSQLATHVLSVYENIAGRPPQWLATIGLGTVYGGSLFVGVVMSCILIAAMQTGGMKGILAAARQRASHNLSTADIRVSYAGGKEPDLNDLKTAPVCLVANFKNVDEAKKEYDQLSSGLAQGESVEQFGQTIFYTMPGADLAARKLKLSEINKVSKDACVDGKQSSVNFRFDAFAPSEAEAIKTQAELEGCLSAPMNYYLTTPWDPTLHETPADAKKHQIARETYQKVFASLSEVWKSNNNDEFREKFEEAVRQGDQTEVQKLSEERGKLTEKLRKDVFERYKNMNDDSIDKDVVAKLEAQERDRSKKGAVDDDDDREDVSDKMPADTQIAPLMGQLPLVKKSPAPGATRYSCLYGHVNRNGVVLTITFMKFENSADGARALIAWLDKKQFNHMHYSFDTRFSGLK